MKPKLKLGLASGVITPKGKISLWGQFHTRLSQYVESDLTANCAALSDGDNQLVICSCDLEGIGRSLYLRIQELVELQCPEIDADAMMIFATHTHTGPAVSFTDEDEENAVYAGLRSSLRYLPEGYTFRDETEETMRDDPEYLPEDEAVEQVAQGVAAVIVKAWENRKQGYFGPAFGRCVLGHCRRAGYNDGTARMYGTTNTAAFVALEGGEDSGMELLYFFNEEGKPIGAIANTACPSQIVEMGEFVSSDFWGKARDILHEKLGEDFVLVGMCAPAGDQAPRDLVRRDEGKGRKRREDVDHMYDLEGAKLYGKRVANTVLECLPEGEANKKNDGYLETRLIHLDLPVRKVTPTQNEAAKREYMRKLQEFGRKELTPFDLSPLHPLSGDMRRFELQDKHHIYDTEVVVARLDDMAFASSPFELYMDFGNQIRARSVAAQTFLAQLANDEAGYLPTEKGEKGGHYSAYVSSGIVGHEGGELLVEKTLAVIDELFLEED